MDLPVSQNLVELRKAAGLTQEQLAERLFVTRQAVSKWERGESRPDLDTVVALAELYNVSTDDLLRRPVEPAGEIRVNELADSRALQMAQRKKLARSMCLFAFFVCAALCLAIGVVFSSLASQVQHIWLIWFALPILAPLIFGLRYYGVFGKTWILYFINVPIICVLVFEACILLIPDNYGAWLCFLFIPLYYAVAITLTVTSIKHKRDAARQSSECG